MTISRARITGAVYLLYFVTVIGAVALIGRTPAALSDAANLVANAVYIVVTLLLYQPFNRVSRNEVDLPAARSGRLDGPLRSRLANVSFARRGKA